jgi:hypothetical protein
MKTTLKYNLEKLKLFSELEENWDGEMGLPISTVVLDYIEGILHLIPKQPLLFPTGRGSAQIEHNKRNGEYLEAEFFDNRIKILKIDKYVDEIDEFTMTPLDANNQLWIAQMFNEFMKQ